MTTSELRLAELIGALSYALDITEGQPEGHCVRCCLIGMRLGRELGLPEPALAELYYTLLLKDLGCSSNAARICELYIADDLAFKRDVKQLNDDQFFETAQFALEHTALGAGLWQRFKVLLSSLRTKEAVAQELIVTRCQRGASIARRLRFDERVALGIHSLDEHWNGQGRPEQLAGDAIPIYSRIALLAQVVDVFHTKGGAAAALAEAEKRRGGWFDPALVDCLLALGPDDQLWQKLSSPDLADYVFAEEPAQFSLTVDDEYLDEIAAAFGEVVDSKSPYTSGHSTRVAAYTDLIAAELGVPAERRRWLHRGALLHDVGKLGVSNAILDKPGKLSDEEWAAVRKHATYTEEILSRIPQFRELAVVSAAHHERLDGAGYPRGLQAEHIALETRIITTADIFDAITAKRPYRDAVPVPRTLEIMAKTLGTALDPACFAALERVVVRLDLPSHDTDDSNATPTRAA
ncbi:MAG TPA: HD-GYP domain-containing protein [Polyangiaceae bacterium]|nr:HD-GYP domain-containing protein [Polyangiaceae bacterium]